MANDALHKAAYNGNLSEVRRILETHPDPDGRDSFGGTALHAAMFQDNMEIVTLLIEYGLDVNAIGPQNGYSPMHDAVWGDNLAALKILLHHGGNPNIVNKEGKTPYEKAQKERKSELVAFFESQGITK